jgi:hypothetical protein
LFQDSTTANNSVNEFDFPSLDLSKSMFTSEDHTKILTQADNLLQATKCQLLDMQMAMECEEESFQVESNPSTTLLSRLVDLNANFCVCMNVLLGSYFKVVAGWIRGLLHCSRLYNLGRVLFF